MHDFLELQWVICLARMRQCGSDRALSYLMHCETSAIFPSSPLPFSAGLHQSPYTFCDPPCWLFIDVLKDKLKGKADLYIFTCPSKCHIHMCTAVICRPAPSGTAWQRLRFLERALPGPWSLSIPSHNIYALLSCVTCMWRPAYQRTRCLAVLLRS